MSLSVFDLFKIGIGPSSSHTVGPMRGLKCDDLLQATEHLKVELYGSLGATGKGHGSDKAVLLGLEGELPEEVETSSIPQRMAAMRESRELRLLGEKTIRFDVSSDLQFIRKPLAFHPNGMLFRAFDAAGLQLRSREYYSVGGGFVVDRQVAGSDRIVEDRTPLPYPFHSAAELLALCSEHGLSIS
ncbi:MAG TPA: L-serine ammonia-lyase, partial [Pseudomonas sp.]|nr:L-serine ammonia-lyase [Pseudomonas sp.]